MRKLFLFILSLLVGIGLFIWTIKVVGWEEIENAFLAFTGWKGAAIVGLTGLAIFLNIVRWKFVLKTLGHRFGILDLFRSYLAGYAISFLAPMLVFAGELFRGYSLKEKYQVPWAKAMGSVVIDRLLETTLFLVTIVFSLLYFAFKIGLPPKNLGFGLGFAFVILVTGIGFFYFKSFRKESIIKMFVKNASPDEPNSLLEIEKEIFSFFKIKKKAMWQGFGLAFLRVLAGLARAWILILFLGKGIGLFSAFSILGFSFMAVMLPIPAALGSHEAIQSFVFNSFGLEAGTGTAFAILVRGAELIMVLTGVLMLFNLGYELISIRLIGKIKKVTSYYKNKVKNAKSK